MAQTKLNNNAFASQKIKTKVLKVLAGLDKRQQDIIVRRFGLAGKPAETLDRIGKRYGITRERVRQIVNSVLAKLRSQGATDNLAEEIKLVEEAIVASGGVITDKELIKKIIGDIVDDSRAACLLFTLHLGGQFIEQKENGFYYRVWYTTKNKKALGDAQKTIDQLAKALTKIDEAIPQSKIIDTYKDAVAGSRNVTEDILLNYLSISKEIAQNCFGEWGFVVWGEVMPRGVRDKAYLVLKHGKRAMHFTEITKEINKLGIDNKTAFAPTVHNELIKDKRFVLVGRGLYALTDWGYMSGTVKEVMSKILAENSKTMLVKELVGKVLQERDVKRSTIILNLKNDDAFAFIDKNTVELAK